MDGRRRDLVAAMIMHAPPLAGASAPDAADRRLWLDVLGRLRVGEECGCGVCPSFTLELDGRPAPQAGRRHILVASAGRALVLLTVEGGVVSGLEVAPGGDEAVDLPEVTELTF